MPGKKSRVFLLLEPAAGTGVEDRLPLVRGAHLPGVVGHSLVATSRAAPVNHGSLELRPFLRRRRRGRPRLVEHDAAAHRPALEVSHRDAEGAANTGDRVLRPGQRQDGAAVRTEVQVRLEPGAGARAVHAVPDAAGRTAAPPPDRASRRSASPAARTRGAPSPDPQAACGPPEQTSAPAPRGAGQSVRRAGSPLAVTSQSVAVRRGARRAGREDVWPGRKPLQTLGLL